MCAFNHITNKQAIIIIIIIIIIMPAQTARWKTQSQWTRNAGFSRKKQTTRQNSNFPVVMHTQMLSSSSFVHSIYNTNTVQIPASIHCPSTTNHHHLPLKGAGKHKTTRSLAASSCSSSSRAQRCVPHGNHNQHSTTKRCVRSHSSAPLSIAARRTKHIHGHSKKVVRKHTSRTKVLHGSCNHCIHAGYIQTLTHKHNLVHVRCSSSNKTHNAK